MFDLVCLKYSFFHDLTKLVLCKMDIILLNKKDIDSKTILHKKLCNMHIALCNMHIVQVSIAANILYDFRMFIRRNSHYPKR